MLDSHLSTCSCFLISCYFFLTLKILIYHISPLLFPLFLNNWITQVTDFLHYASLNNWVKLIQNKVTHFISQWLVWINICLFFHCLFITSFFLSNFPRVLLLSIVRQAVSISIVQIYLQRILCQNSCVPIWWLELYLKS